VSAILVLMVAGCDLVLGLDDYHAASDAGARDAGAIERTDGGMDGGGADGGSSDAATLPDAHLPDAGPMTDPPPPPVLAGSNYVSCAMATRDGIDQVFCWGYGANGELGDQSMSTLTNCPDETVRACARSPGVPVRTPAGVLGSVSSIVGRGAAVCAIHTASRQLSCWGSLAGVRTSHASSVVTADDVTLTGVVAFDTNAVGQEHACAALASGAVLCWGRNEFGQLGIGSTANLDRPNADVPVSVSLVSPRLPDPAFVGVATAAYHSCALEALPSGRVFCWGRGGTSVWHSLIGDGDLHLERTTAPETAATLPLPAVAIRAGADHVCALLTDGSVHCWGDPALGRLGRATDGLAPSRIPLPGRASAIATADATTCAIVNDGSVFCWGSNAYGVAGQGTEGEMVDMPMMLALPPDVDAASIAMGRFHGCVRDITGADRCWGSNHRGQLGDPAFPGVEQWIPVRVAWP
jgi:alpha-tubulin suppressor-like RCC1 family protein